MSESVLAAIGTSCGAGDPLLRPGNGNCGGCGMSSALQFLGRAREERRIQVVIPASCAAVAVGQFPYSAMGVPTILTTFGSAAAVATGMSLAARLNGEGTRVVCWAGDGGTYDIGMASLSGAAERNEDILYVCYDNEIYGNTGGQRSSATPHGAATSNTLRGKAEQKKDILGIMAAHRIPYAAWSRWPIPRTPSARCAAPSTCRASASSTCSRRARPAGSRSRRWASSWCASRSAPGSSRWWRWWTAGGPPSTWSPTSRRRRSSSTSRCSDASEVRGRRRRSPARHRASLARPARPHRPDRPGRPRG